MLKAMARTEDGALILLGLSFANIDRLKAGQPIMFLGSAIDMAGTIDRVYIIAAPNEEEMRAELEKRGMIGPETRVTEDPPGAEYVRRDG